MRRTEYFYSIETIYSYKMDEVIEAAKKQRDFFISDIGDALEEIIDEKIDISWAGTDNNKCCCILSLTYYERK